MELKHTKGEWKVKPYDDIVSGFDIETKNEKICIDVGGINLGEAEANAKLIAAAPDLLEALIEAKERLYAGIKREDLTIRGQKLLDKINNAIKKATE